MNEDQQTNEYLKKLKDIKLSESSRTRIESNLEEYAKFHPVRIEEVDRSMKQVPESNWRTSLLNVFKFKQPKSMTAAIVAIALIVGGGTSYAAEGAVPGDTLYVVKTEVNENIKSALAIGNEAEAKLQARLTQERLEEAEELASRGGLTAETAVSLSTQVKAHTEEAEKRSAKAETEGKFETSATVRASLEGSMRSSVAVLTDLNARVSGNNGASLITDLKTYADTTATAQIKAGVTVDASIGAKVTAENMVNRAGSYLVEIETKLERAKAQISAEAHARVQAKLGEAVEAKVKAETSFKAEAYRTAYTSAQTAVRIASEVEAMINSLLRLKIDIGSDVDGRGILDVKIDSDVNTRTDTDTDTQTDNDQDSSVDIDVDIKTDTRVDTDVIDVGVETDTSASGGLRL